MAGGRSSAPSCVGLRSTARRSRSCSASRARLFRPAAALSPPQARTKGASYPLLGNIVGGAMLRLIGAVLLEQNDEWQLQARYMQVEPMTEFTLIDPSAEIAALPAKAA